MTRKSTHALPLLALALLLAMASLAGCRHGSEEPLGDSERLERLDARIRQHPDDADLLHERGALLLRMRRTTPAIADLRRAAELDDDNPQYLADLGDAYFSAGQAGKAYETMEKALRLSPDDKDALLKMSEITFYSKDYDRAMETLGKVTAQDPTNRTALFMKAFIYKERGDTAAAARLFQRVTELHPSYAPAYEELCLLHARRHDPMALEYLQTVLRLDTTNTTALYAVAMMYQEMEEADKANELYVKMLERDPRNAQAWHNRGWLCLALYQDYPAAEEFLTRALECDPAMSEALVNRGLARELQGRRADAADDYRAALAQDPANDKAREGLERVE